MQKLVTWSSRTCIISLVLTISDSPTPEVDRVVTVAFLRETLPDLFPAMRPYLSQPKRISRPNPRGELQTVEVPDLAKRHEIGKRLVQLHTQARPRRCLWSGDVLKWQGQYARW
ncbi:hypothetical protein MES5069_410032 [Mesorhizobium escarrei]|uniref:Uncharacterized protein n=1 Tax=Mesorhizobium escarrei TaxID=666018 RepID=A0ABN8K233_9HYPH|nr:hypothetical protein MES5069_410032 [Mesorhizobium escarrei]